MHGREGRLEDVGTLDSRQFVIGIRKLADALSYGTDRSPFLGAGIEYVQSRLYQPGDPIKSIDWRVTGRTGRFFVKEYEAPRSMAVHLVIDTSASMTVGSTPRTKYATALFVAGGLALAALDRVSPVGVLGAGERVLRIRPSLSSRRVLQWLLELRAFRFDERTTLAERLREFVPSVAERALFVVLSDLHDETALDVIKLAGQRHDVVVLQLQDPAELGLRGTGFFRAREAETGREFTTHGRARWTDPDRARAELKRAGVDHMVLRTDEAFVPKLRHLFRARVTVGRGAR
ncbi:MAG: DUF58 domain-containing protein [Planctomycetes bacterium]|nr:DUF58 domain-containing protein [Planctomycetota bacterium]